VIWVRNGADLTSLNAATTYWHRLHHVTGDDIEEWEEILEQSPSLRRVLAERLERLAAPAGPWRGQAVRCARAVTECFDLASAAPSFPGTSPASTWEAATGLVDHVMNPALGQPADIRTYAVLVAHVLDALRFTRNGLSTALREARAPRDETLGPRILLDLPAGPGDDVDLTTALLLSSLTEVVQATAADDDTPDPLPVGTDDFDLTVSPRTEVSALDDLMELARRAERPAAPARAGGGVRVETAPRCPAGSARLHRRQRSAPTPATGRVRRPHRLADGLVRGHPRHAVPRRRRRARLRRLRPVRGRRRRWGGRGATSVRGGRRAECRSFDLR
jgi:hypothetical protein